MDIAALNLRITFQKQVTESYEHRQRLHHLLGYGVRLRYRNRCCRDHESEGDYRFHDKVV